MAVDILPVLKGGDSLNRRTLGDTVNRKWTVSR
jgi:hypothetical protein